MLLTTRRTSAPRRRDGRRYVPQRKVCIFCADKSVSIDYKNVATLRRFITDRGKMEPRRRVGNCAKHQRALSRAIKRARHVALLPYTATHIRQTAGAGIR